MVEENVKVYDIVKKARQVDRITSLEVIEALCDDFVELFGDRQAGDDKAMVGGVGYYEKQPITVIGIQKGHTTEENILRNFGSAGPMGYRKAERLMKQAEKFNRPVLTLVNTAGANATVDSEKGGISEAIAHLLQVMGSLQVPTLAIILGEGGSGGALALAFADEVWMLEDAIYSVITPETLASIVYRDAKYAPQAAEDMTISSDRLLDLGIIDRVIPERRDGVDLDNSVILHDLVQAIKEKIDQLQNEDMTRLLSKRYDRYRQF